MRRFLRRLIASTAALVAAFLVWVMFTLPPATTRHSRGSAAADLVNGAYHIHSARSDGSGTVDDIAAAAMDAGIQFVIITDHGDATRAPDPPVYRHGVLCIDAVEISSTGGHVVALDLRTAAPFPLAGEPGDVVEDIHRLGGKAVAAHPDSPRPSLRWRGDAAVADGIEWLNVDSEWRARGFGTVAAAARALFRPAESVVSLFRLPTLTLARWDAALAERSMFSLAAVDAHARLGGDIGAGLASSISFPSYETMFRTVTQTVKLEHPLTGDAGADAAAVLNAITAGRSYSVVRAFIDAPFALTFSASTPDATVELAGDLRSGPATFRAGVPAGTGARLILIHGGREVAAGLDRVEYGTSDAGTYRVEARLPDRAAPWIVSNAIQLGERRSTVIRRAPEDVLPVAAGGGPPVTAIPLTSWVIESSPTSSGRIVIAGRELHLNYRLGPGAPAGQFMAIASNVGGEKTIERVEFTASSTKPIRVSVQTRTPGGINGQRWQRSIYVDQVGRRVSLSLTSLEPVDRHTELRPGAERARSILFVLDTLNSFPGTEGEVVFRDVVYVAGR